MTVDVHTLTHFGTVLTVLGVTVCVVALVVWILVGHGVSMGRPVGGLHKDDTYLIVVRGTGRLLFLLPVVGGALLAWSGLAMRKHATAVMATDVWMTENAGSDTGR
ncbi:MAG: hypothetical protein EOP85_16530 [Verrucomicrobiaceae bacterium]|nr:MAG: hypothetical protein EOP85_16530 [Verrucomicrobiaceae bacterium]